MHFTPREIDKLMIHMLAHIAQQRRQQGLKLNHPETVSIVAAAALDGARAGKTVEEVMDLAGKVVTQNDVMEGVADMLSYIQVEAVFTDGSRLVTIHNPIK
ncbi:urease subunit gamma [Roseomonas xinghualingensis]|uniref:urease subunit gamma n=1 Tax=Roseomonas xinghualingensis TaxID=2986475 RepID=UPI0021F0C47D|nr:urease subunit gamma [Roseomonas sp. SXEYE001]MCV4208186.1 urease subunit gamma [Roseomonas sp. SXEYE001]